MIGLGLPNINELGWRWRDALIYVTHGMPNEPTFSAAAVVRRVSPTPLAAIHSTHESSSRSPKSRTVLAAANEPKRLWIVPASDHRFSDNLAEFDRRLLEAIAWVRANASAVRASMSERLRQAIPVAIGLALFVVALEVLRSRARVRSRGTTLTADVFATPSSRLALAVALTALNYAALTGYDLLAFAYIGKSPAAAADRRRVVSGLRDLQQRRASRCCPARRSAIASTRAGA